MRVLHSYSRTKLTITYLTGETSSEVIERLKRDEPVNPYYGSMESAKITEQVVTFMTSKPEPVK